MYKLDAALLQRFDRAVPRYTSYPTAPQFRPIDPLLYLAACREFDKTDKPLSIYIHIPFCKQMCLFCACSVTLNRSPEKQQTYLDALLQEIDLIPFKTRRKVSQLHLGGGTPTSLESNQMESLLKKLHQKFDIAGEISIEIDPRTVHADGGKKLEFLHSLGFNRVSFGVQDLDPRVQEAVRRRQTEEMTVDTFVKAQKLGFEGINLDLIYGLPLQTRQSFAKTIGKILVMRPSRIALFSYAYVPWLKPHQKAIPEKDLPSTEEKLAIYAQARESLIQGGYFAIGMDHFCLPEDPIAKAYTEKTLTRNFQGYSIQLAEDMIGFGVTSIGFLQNIFFQNHKEIQTYSDAIAANVLPIERGYVLKEEDCIRRWVIQSLMCQFEVDKAKFAEQFGKVFDEYFAQERSSIAQLKEEGLVEETESFLLPTPLGRLFIRLVASVFDAYLTQGNYSKSV